MTDPLLPDTARCRTGGGSVPETAPVGGDYADEWGLIRRWAMQQARADRNEQLAYRRAANHGQTSGRGFREGEGFAGWIALRQLGDAPRALRHFERFHPGVETPVSKSRGAYWAGRGAEAAGEGGGRQNPQSLR